jgi:chromosome segregation ATPase
MDSGYYRFIFKTVGEPLEMVRQAREAYLTGKLGQGRTGLHEDGSVAYDEIDPEDKVRLFLQRDMPEVSYEAFEKIWVENESLRDRIVHAQRAYDQEHDAAVKNYRLYTVAVRANKDVMNTADAKVSAAEFLAKKAEEASTARLKQLQDHRERSEKKIAKMQDELKAAKLKIKELQKSVTAMKKAKGK